MNEKDLMIGDWVWFNPNVFIEDEYEPPKPCYPTKIDSGEDIDLAIEDCYAPIPLTEDILEKNGWRYNKVDDVFYPKMLKGELPWIVRKEGTFRVKDFCTISYVHQLQHALRLCGIEKEIEL